MSLSGRFSELAKLEPNWDSHGGNRIDRGCLQRAQEMFYALRGQWSVVPMSSGGVALTLYEDGMEIEIEIEPAPSRDTGDRR